MTTFEVHTKLNGSLLVNADSYGTVVSAGLIIYRFTVETVPVAEFMASEVVAIVGRSD